MLHENFHFIADYLWAICVVSLWFPAALWRDILVVLDQPFRK